MIVRPGIVCPSSSLATRPNDDCDVGILLTRESWVQLKSDGSKALSPFSNVTVLLQLCYNCVTFLKNRLHLQKCVL